MKPCHTEQLKETASTKNGFRRFVCQRAGCNQVWFHGESGWFQQGRPRDPFAKVTKSIRVHPADADAIDRGEAKLKVVRK